jgi:hypothetical protein
MDCCLPDYHWQNPLISNVFDVFNFWGAVKVADDNRK